MKFTQEKFARHMRDINGSAIREIFKLLAKPGMISFAGGNPSNTALEPEIISDLAQQVLARYGTTLLQYGATDGFMPFRESAAGFLRTEGVNCEAAGKEARLRLLLQFSKPRNPKRKSLWAVPGVSPQGGYVANSFISTP